MNGGVAGNDCAKNAAIGCLLFSGKVVSYRVQIGRRGEGLGQQKGNPRMKEAESVSPPA
jgi:hypothetical protein